MRTELVGLVGAVMVVILVLSGLVMTLYWEKDALHRFGAALRMVLRGGTDTHRRQRLALIVVGVCLLWSAGALVVGSIGEAMP